MKKKAGLFWGVEGRGAGEGAGIYRDGGKTRLKGKESKQLKANIFPVQD